MNQIICTSKTELKVKKDYVMIKKKFLLKIIFYILTTISIIYYLDMTYINQKRYQRS